MSEPLAVLEVVRFIEQETKFDHSRRGSKNGNRSTFEPFIGVKKVPTKLNMLMLFAIRL